ncbi:MAG: translation elongation factor Ts [Bacteroidales bacterium]|jgi:elongation factor Ts|nr:translation elongation factor Ts [Bacteroidales bacterium]
MANITAALVNELRQRTGVGMMDCKKALVECDGDMDKAIDYLREKGQKLATKRADRDASEGVVLAGVNTDKTFSAIIMMNCETDFVAKNEAFVAFTKSVLDAAIASKAKTAEEVLALNIAGTSVETMIVEQVAKIGEKIAMTHYQYVEAPVTYAYIHQGNGLASIIGFSKAGFDAQGKEIAMQVAAMAPVALDRGTVSADVIEKELEIYRVQIREEGKPENMIEKIAEGKLNKFFKDSTLLSQDFIRENKKSVGDYLKENDKDLTVTEFKRLKLGE